jgi:von Willebrand factor type A domain
VISIGGEATAAADLSPYLDIHLLVDVSGSMGIGATPDDLAIMRTAVGCSFGCHLDGTYQRARNAGAKMRIDVVREAITRVIASSTDVENVRFAIHVFSSRFRTLSLPTDRDTAALAATSIMLDTTHGAGTNLHKAFADIDDLIPAAGNGSSDTERKQVVILLTDGVEDSAYFKDGSFIEDPAFVENAPTFRDHYRLQGVDPAMCAPVKDRGVQVMAMYMPYMTSNEDGRYDFIRNVLTPEGIQSSLQECASSSSNAFAASSPEEIDAGMRKLFQQALLSVRLTQ